MIIKHSTTVSSINQDSLPTRPIDISVALKDLGAATSRAALSAGIYIRPVDVGAPAHADRVLLPGCGLSGLVAAADARAEEEVVIRRAVIDVGALHGVAARGVVGDLGGRCRDRGRGVVHLGLIDYRASVSVFRPR